MTQSIQSSSNSLSGSNLTTANGRRPCVNHLNREAVNHNTISAVAQRWTEDAARRAYWPPDGAEYWTTDMEIAAQQLVLLKGASLYTSTSFPDELCTRVYAIGTRVRWKRQHYQIVSAPKNGEVCIRREHVGFDPQLVPIDELKPLISSGN